MDANMSLLDAMAVQAGCEFLSDLRYIDDLSGSGWPGHWRRSVRSPGRCSSGTTPWNI